MCECIYRSADHGQENACTQRPVVELYCEQGFRTVSKGWNFTKNVNPAMNISYALDIIMDPETGLRTLNIPYFKANDQLQSLWIVSLTV